MEAQDKKDKTMLGYRIVEIKNGKVYSLFHGTRGKPCLLADEILIRGEDVCFS